MWEDLLGGGSAALGYWDLYNRLDKDKGQVGNDIGDLQQGVDDRTRFTPWGVTSAFGQGGYGSNGQMNFNLSPEAAQGAAGMWGAGLGLMNRASQDPAARQQDLYEAMRAGQMPGEQRALQGIDQSAFNTGRTGMGTNAYGSSPERFAFEKARAEADNSAWLGAQNTANQELMNQYNMGSGMMNQSMLPHKMLMDQMGMGQNNAQLMQNAQLNNASLWAQLGLGGMSNKLNYSNLQTKMLGDMYGAGSSMLGGLGGAADSSGGWGGLWDTITGKGGDVIGDLIGGGWKPDGGWF